ncbi:MAG TPA: hypothetical protein VII28_04940, partial [Puia sp.]
MKRIVTVGLVTFLGVFFCSGLRAQKNAQNLISGTFHDQTIKEFTGEIETQTDYFFYFDTSLFDSLRINLTANRDPLSSVLDQVFAKTDFKYSIGPHNEVFLTKGVFVQTNLTAVPADTGKDKRRGYIAGKDETLNPATHLQTATLENKLYQIGTNSANNGQL